MDIKLYNPATCKSLSRPFPLSFPSIITPGALFSFFISPVPLGSIPELPAESCAEIKASEGERVVSGAVWLDPTNSGKAAVARCHMETKGLESHLWLD